jgi:hypothetical protein
MTINAISNNLQSQYSRRSNLTEKANAIYAKLNEDEQNFLDKDTVEKALQDISVIELSNQERFSLDSSSAESIDSQKQTSTSQYELAAELAIRLQGSENQIGKQQRPLNLSIDDSGVLVRTAMKDDSADKDKNTNSSSNNRTEGYRQAFNSIDNNQPHIKIIA